MSQSGSVAFVTGAASGIGESIARRLTGEGYRVIIADRDRTAGARVAASLETALFLPVDVSDPDSVRHAVASVTDEVGQIDVLVNSAGLDALGPFVDSDEADWRLLIDVNLLGAIRTTREILPGMIARRRGRIVNISSEAGRIGAAGQAVYSATKGGLTAFGKSVAQETAALGVTVNTVSPGLTATPPVQALVDTGDEIVDALLRSIPAQRLAQPADIAGAVAFLVSDDAAYITGQTLSVSGGISMV